MMMMMMMLMMMMMMMMMMTMMMMMMMMMMLMRDRSFDKVPKAGGGSEQGATGWYVDVSEEVQYWNVADDGTWSRVS
jgi:hypothetical protein